MTAQPEDLYELLCKIRYDLSSAQAKVTDAFAALDALDLPTRPTAQCAHCGLDFRGPLTLAEHTHLSHNGPVPDHWLAIEARSLEPEAAA